MAVVKKSRVKGPARCCVGEGTRGRERDGEGMGGKVSGTGGLGLRLVEEKKMMVGVGS